MADSIEALYREYRKRLEEIDRVEQELLDTDDKETWKKMLVRKSELIRSFYRDTEHELEDMIRPILNGEHPITEQNAGALYSGAISYYSNVLSDDILEAQMFVKLWEYYHVTGNEFFERNCRFAFLDNPYINVEGKVQQIAADQNDWVGSYVDRIGQLRLDHPDNEEFYREVRKIMEAVRKQYHTESVKYNPDVNELIRLFNRFSKIFRYRDCFEERFWEQLMAEYEETGTDVLFIAAMHWKQVSPDKKQQFEDTYPAAYLEQKRLKKEDRSMKKYVGYLVYAFYSGTLPPEKTFPLLHSYLKSMTKDYDFNSSNWFQQPSDSKFAFYCHAFRPMLEMLEYMDVDHADKNRIRAGLLYELKLYISSIPRECQCKEYLDQALYHMLFDIVPFIDDEEQAIELIDTMVISRQLATLIHTVMTAKLSSLITEAIVDRKPELFLSALPTDDPAVVQDRKNELVRESYNTAKLHDIGKILISNIVNMQIRHLSENEFSYIKYHPKWSHDILVRNSKLRRYADAALGHHRSFDGKSGYPMEFDNTASGKKIFIDILTIADCMDAATDMLGRNYAEGKTFDTVISEMHEMAGTMYNPEIVSLMEENSELYRKLRKETGVESRIDTCYRIYRTYR